MNISDVALGEAPQEAHRQPASDELLRWLLQYPFLRAEDLAAALGYSAAQCYRSLAELRRHGWVEAVTVPTLGISRARLYHLTREGVRMIAECEGVDSIALARCFRADERHLLALLVRAPALVSVQTLIRGMVTQAPVALASAHRPCRVTWSWVRDYRLSAGMRDQSDHPLSFILDAYLILHAAHADGAASRQGSQQAGHLSSQPAAAALVPREADRAPAGSRPHMGWYGALVLHDAGLMPELLMARRLRTLLVCREAPDRWTRSSAYAVFPPLLVLTPDARRAQRWRLVARSAITIARLDPLRGGVLVMTTQALAAPWRAGWYAFDGSSTHRLADLLIPSTAEALPPIPIPQHLRADASKQGSPAIDQAIHPGLSPSDTAHSRRSYPICRSPMLRPIVGSYNRRAVKQASERRCACADQESTHRSAHSREQLVLASLHLGTRHMETLRLLHDHPLLSRTELAAALAVDEGSAARYLSHLRRDGWVSTITARPGALGWSASVAAMFSRPYRSQGHSVLEPAMRSHAEPRGLSARERFLVSGDGLRLLAASTRLRLRSLRRADTLLHTGSTSPGAHSFTQDESLMLAYRGCVADADLHSLLSRPHIRALLRHPAHTAGVYAFFTMLLRTIEHVRLLGHPCALLWWETGHICFRRYRYHERWHNFRPDGAGAFLTGGVGGRRVPFWLEWDRGTMSLRDLRAKLAAYAEYVQSREWRTDGNSPLPLLLIVTTETDGETRMTQALDDALPPRTPLAVRIAIASAVHEHGPLAEIWRPWIPRTTSGRGVLGPPGPLAAGAQ